MWILECSGNDLKGKKRWLRPGKKFIFGRTKADEIGEPIILSHKTISRKHLAIEISEASTDDLNKPNLKSKIIIKDFNTKIGTILNGEQIRGQSLELRKDQNHILLGRYEHSYSIKWYPVTLSFSFTSRERNSKSHAKLYQKIGLLDIKVLDRYESDHTTHVVARKRNTPKGLQALIDGKYIVHYETFIDALLAATSQIDGKLSSLEIDFDGNFPDPIQYLPPKGDEPTQHDEITYTPSKLRKSIFISYSFVFYEKKQYENLLQPITAGGGKGFLRVVNPYQTTVEDFVRFVKDVDEGKGVIVVKFNPAKGPESEWYARFGMEVALQLNHRLVEQNEFLNAVLENDASILKRPLRVEELGTLESPILKHSVSHLLNNPMKKESSPPLPIHTRTRRNVRPKFLGFDDDFSGPSNIPSIAVIELNTKVTNTSAIEVSASQSQGLFIPQDVNHSSVDNETQTRELIGLKKKTASTIEENFEEEEEEFLSPQIGSRSKRRRLNTEAELIQQELSPVKKKKSSVTRDVIQGTKSYISTLLRQNPKKNIIDIDAEIEEMLLLKLHNREKSDISAEANQEYLCTELDSFEISEIRCKIQVEEAKVRSPKQAQRRRPKDSDRWDSDWDSRKNFKRFRIENGKRKALAKVIVQLQEVKPRDCGKFDDFLREIHKTKSAKTIHEKDEISGQLIYHEEQELSPSQDMKRETEVKILSSYQTPSHDDNDFSIQSRNLSELSNPIKSSSFSQRESSSIKKLHPHMNVLRDDQTSLKNSNSRKRATPHVINQISGSSSQSSLAKKQKLSRTNRGVDENEEDESEDELRFRFKKKSHV